MMYWSAASIVLNVAKTTGDLAQVVVVVLVATELWDDMMCALV